MAEEMNNFIDNLAVLRGESSSIRAPTNAVSAAIGVALLQSAFSVISSLGLNDYLLPLPANISDNLEFDYIIVGGGTSGCILANRLTEDKETSVLLLEAGENTAVETNYAGLLQYANRKDTIFNYVALTDGNAQQCHTDKIFRIVVPKQLGGTSAGDMMQYTRGNSHDFKLWAEASQDSSWRYYKLLPYFKKSENLTDELLRNSPDGIYHGYDGPWKVSKDRNPVISKYLEAYEELGYPVVDDLNGKTFVGYTQAAKTMTKHRQATSIAFLKPAKDRDNLYLITEFTVTKIIMEGITAIGVKGVDKNNKKITYKAKKEVIISAGAINSAKLLLLSGIGPKYHLISKLIKTVADLPVGENLESGLGAVIVHTTEELPPPVGFDPHEYPSSVFMGAVALKKKQKYPDYLTENYIVRVQHYVLQFCSTVYKFKPHICDNIYKELGNKEFLYTVMKNAYTYSRGKVTLKSSDPKDDPVIMINSYSNDTDLQNQIKFVKDLVRIGKSSFFERIGAKRIDPTGRCGAFKEGSNDYWECYLRCMSFIMDQNHLSGTCAMGKVVDGRLAVIGIKSLRVADASIMPVGVSGNIAAASVMIAEKAADMIKEDNS